MKRVISSMLIVLIAGLGFGHAQDSIADALRLDDDLSTFRTILELSDDVGELLGGEGAFTLLAPDNEAFTNLSGAALEALFDDVDVALSFLENHILEGTLTLDILFELLDERGGQMELPTVGGNEVSFALSTDGAIIVNGIAGFVGDGVITGTGVLHSISTILPYDVDEDDDDDTEL